MATQAHTGYTSEYRQASPTPRTRSSTESSATKASLVRRDSLQYANADGQDDLVPTTFDESALRLLIDMDVRSGPIVLVYFVYANLCQKVWGRLHARSH
jgi:hypothetical protein